MGMRTQGQTTLQVNTTGIFMPKGVFGVSYWSSRRRLKDAREGPPYECRCIGNFLMPMGIFGISLSGAAVVASMALETVQAALP